MDSMSPLIPLASSTTQSASSAAPWLSVLPPLEVAGLVVLAGLLVVALRALARLSDLAALIASQSQSLDQLAALVSRAAAQRSDLDLRRIEHVLIDIRDGQGRLEHALAAERRVANPSGAEPAAPTDPADALLERIHNRLYALGFERVQIVGERSNLTTLVDGRGSIGVEARKGTTVHKGRVLISAGRILDVEMRPPYAMFP